MSYRLVGTAERQIDAILLQSAEAWGIEAAANYNRLMLSVFDALAVSPERVGVRRIGRTKSLRAFPLRLARCWMAVPERVDSPRHIVVFRVADDGIVEILGLAHDRMLLGRTARRMQRET